jgi:hypothetical protein
MAQEIWKNVNGFDGYIVSNTGKLARINKTDKKTKPLSLTNYDKDGYIKTSMNQNGKRHYLRLHRIVAENFLENPDSLPVVNHKDGNKLNNHVDNLEWCTVSYNTKHAFDVLGRKGHNGGMNKRIKIIKDKKETIFETQRECAKYLDTHDTIISKYIIDGKNYKGYQLVRIDEAVTTIENTSN